MPILDIDALKHKFFARRSAFLAALAALFLLSMAEAARADHSMQKPCIDCHSLRSANVVPCSRNVFKDQVTDALYNANWYCGSPWPSSCDNASTQPLDCSYCHSLDIALEIQLAYGGKFNPVNGVGSSHPVDVVGDGFAYPANKRITCNDCHNGGGKITPVGLCAKNDTDGYPNHIDTIISQAAADLPGNNKLSMNNPYLTGPYGPGLADYAGATVGGRDWAKAKFDATDVLCFICHDNDKGKDGKPLTTKPPFSTGLDESTMTNIMGEYNLAGGGHNVPGIGAGSGGATFGNKKLACYNCHDPHSGRDPDVLSRINKALIVPVMPGAGIINPYEPAATNVFTFSLYDPATSGDRALCLTCHDSASTVRIETNKAVAFQNPIQSANMKFGFHESAHADVISSGNCLQANGGCHQSPHNTSPYDCLGCHTSAMPNYANVPQRLKRVTNVDSEFDHIGAIKNNGILSKHNIPYKTFGDLSTTDDNGCLSCHGVGGSITGIKVALPDGTPFTPPAMDVRESLKAYNAFCLGCHDGSADLGESFPDPDTDPVSGPAPIKYRAPRVEKYFTKGGHGTGLASNHFESGNTDAKIPCLECHMYHGSTAYKLLPGNKQTNDYASQTPYKKGGRVVKYFAYSNTSLETTASKFPLGGLNTSGLGSLAIDYRDYSLSGSANNNRLVNDDRRAWYYSDYTNNPAWNTYYEASSDSTLPTDPVGTEVQYGTSGDMLDTSKLGCSQYAQDARAGADSLGTIGFCNACHFFDDKTDGTDKTYGWVYTHEKIPPYPAVDCSGISYPFNPNDSAPPSSVQRFKFHKDCAECHDPHGSGDRSSDNPNWYMIRGKITTGLASTKDTYNVVFDEAGNDGIFVGADSGDEVDSGSESYRKMDNLCTVCHTAVLHNTRTPSGTAHNEGTDCFQCHSHGKH